ncbi:hypothetical protein [Myroides pelagicus]|uniref:hypothetical protein n=1 Tax=Myroides pelagicus TaxID=270914 RepID=UPI002DB6AADE|nr:hypothetical protein [Myroides pelagicus]
MGRTNLNLIKAIAFLLLVVGVILFVKNVDAIIFKEEFNISSILLSIALMTASFLGNRKVKSLKKITI